MFGTDVITIADYNTKNYNWRSDNNESYISFTILRLYFLQVIALEWPIYISPRVAAAKFPTVT